MFISKFKQWLDVVDLYGIHQSTFYKSLVIAPVFVFVYWIFLPANIVAYIIMLYVASTCELPVLASFKKRDQALLFLGVGNMFASITLYLVYPFTGVFFVYSLLVLSLLYYFALIHFYAIKPVVMIIVAVATLIFPTDPPANLQVAYDVFSALALATTTLLICFRLLPNHYLSIWTKALQQFIRCLIEEIDNLRLNEQRPVKEATTHFEMVRNYQRLVGQRYRLKTYRISLYLRNIQLSLAYDEVNEAFWLEVKNTLSELRMNMDTSTSCIEPKLGCSLDNHLERFIFNNLTRAVRCWNELCTVCPN
jgi:hypothetical protein